jgi:hypothetical protein
MIPRIQPGRASILCLSVSLAMFASLAPLHAHAQDADNPKPEQHGRKYKAPPDTSRIEVTVVKGFNKKPIDGAHVIFHPYKDGVDEGSLEVKTHPDGKATIDVIPTGSKVRIQVLADGFATYAEDYQVDEANRAITIAMIRPRAQISTYTDNEGKPSQIEPGVQVPVRPKPATSGSPSSPSGSGTSGSSTSSGGSKPQP